MNAQQALLRIRAQMPLAQKRALADYVLENDVRLHSCLSAPTVYGSAAMKRKTNSRAAVRLAALAGRFC
jgi:dephospho-CoA kinase